MNILTLEDEGSYISSKCCGLITPWALEEQNPQQQDASSVRDRNINGVLYSLSQL